MSARIFKVMYLSLSGRSNCVDSVSLSFLLHWTAWIFILFSDINLSAQLSQLNWAVSSFNCSDSSMYSVLFFSNFSAWFGRPRTGTWGCAHANSVLYSSGLWHVTWLESSALACSPVLLIPVFFSKQYLTWLAIAALPRKLWPQLSHVSKSKNTFL